MKETPIKQLEKQIAEDLIYIYEKYHGQEIDIKFIEEMKMWVRQYIFNLVYGVEGGQEDHAGMIQGYDGKWRWL